MFRIKWKIHEQWICTNSMYYSFNFGYFIEASVFITQCV
jgi:hypothetical protein